MQYRLANACINSGGNGSTSCKNLVNIGGVTLEFTKGDCGIFAATWP